MSPAGSSLLRPSSAASLRCPRRSAKASLNKIWARLRVERVAVRSSGADEDGAQSSFAGVFDSVLDVGREDLAVRYQARACIVLVGTGRRVRRQAGGANIIIQEMVEPEFSGVLFTRDPLDAGRCLVELVKGTAANLVSGLVAPQAYRFGQADRTILSRQRRLKSTSRPCSKSAAGSKTLSALHRTSNGPIATVDSGLFNAGHHEHVLDPLEAEREKALSARKGAPVGSVVFAQTEMTEVLPNPTPLSLSLMQDVWGPGGSVDLACRSLGLDYRARMAGATIS